MFLEGNNHWSAPNVTGAFPHQVKIHEGNHTGEKPFNRGLSLFSFWKRAESDCLHIRLTISIVLRFIHRISTIHPPFNLVCRQSLSALFQKLNNNNPLLVTKVPDKYKWRSTRSMVYNGTGYKGNFEPSTEALFSEWRHCYFITVTS